MVHQQNTQQSLYQYKETKHLPRNARLVWWKWLGYSGKTKYNLWTQYPLSCGSDWAETEAGQCAREQSRAQGRGTRGLLVSLLTLWAPTGLPGWHKEALSEGKLRPRHSQVQIYRPFLSLCCAKSWAERFSIKSILSNKFSSPAVQTWYKMMLDSVKMFLSSSRKLETSSCFNFTVRFSKTLNKSE